MSQKRPMHDQVRHATEAKKRRRTFESVVRKVMFRRSWEMFVERELEPMIRRVVFFSGTYFHRTFENVFITKVREELDQSLKTYFPCIQWNAKMETNSSQTRNLNLEFSSNILLPVFTEAKIKGHDTLKIILVDTISGEVVDSGSESNAKVEIVVLDGDFDRNKSGNWIVEDFESNIVEKRGRGRKPLLMGECRLDLKAGNCLVGDILFTDNSSWTRSRKFRLGARVLDHFSNTRIREAITECFIVRDRRGELYKKHYPPILVDAVWRLEKISRDGPFHQRLTNEDIWTVKDFLTLLTVDPKKLRKILGMTDKMWEVTTQHARTCVLDKEIFSYYLNVSQMQRGVVFNVVGQVLGLVVDSQYVPLDKLSEAEKDDARNLVVAAYQQWSDVIPLKDASLIPGALPLPGGADTRLQMGESSEGRYPFKSLKIFDFGSNLLPEVDDLEYLNVPNLPIRLPSKPEFSDCERLSFVSIDGSDHLHGEFTEDLEDSDNSAFAANLFNKPGTRTDAQRRWKKVSYFIKWLPLWRFVAVKRATF